jgi:hypothetical protein
VAVADAVSTINISEIETETIDVLIRGTRPMILNRLSEKAKHDLLLGTQRKTAADKAANLKHVPVNEFQASPYRIYDDNAPTLIGQPASCFKGAMLTAALRVPGAKKTEIGQCLWVQGDLVPIYGIPQLFMAITRSADINRTPDVRTRAILPMWAAKISVTFTKPMLNETSVINLLSAAGQVSGIGDWRPEKGKGTYGQFVLVNQDDEMFDGIVQYGGREEQIAAMALAKPYNQDTEELLSWFDEEVTRRGRGAQKKGATK